MKDDRKSDSLMLFLGISKAYLLAFEVIWRGQFEGTERSHWDLSLLLHPESHLMGIALETALKGLISCRGGRIKHTHDLEKLLRDLNDPDLITSMDRSLFDLCAPSELIQANPTKEPEEINSFYRKHQFHIEMLNLLYSPPYATRYPVLGGRCLPDPIALRRMICVLQDRLYEESKKWRRD